MSIQLVSTRRFCMSSILAFASRTKKIWPSVSCLGHWPNHFSLHLLRLALDILLILSTRLQWLHLNKKCAGTPRYGACCSTSMLSQAWCPLLVSVLQRGVREKVMAGAMVRHATFSWISLKFCIVSVSSSPVKSKTSVLKTVSSSLPSSTPDFSYSASRSYSEPGEPNCYLVCNAVPD